MTQATSDLIKQLQDFDDKKKYDEIITLLSDEVIKEQSEEQDIIELYIWRGNTWYNKKKYDKAILDYNKALDLNKEDFALTYFNRGFALIAQKKYNEAIVDLKTSFKISPTDYLQTFLFIAAIYKIMGKYNDAIESCNEVIDVKEDYADAYYYRGLIYKEMNLNLEGSINDFKIYLSLQNGKIDNWTKYAHVYINDLKNRQLDKDLNEIANYIFEIKNALQIKDGSISHYSSLSVAKSLFIDKTKFQLSEGNFMNDPSEGTELLRYLGCDSFFKQNNEFFTKPFIGSFVKSGLSNNLNMWRFYGKQNGTEAMGCSITIKILDFIYEIQSTLVSKEKNISDINFYRVAYINKDRSIIIPDISTEQTSHITTILGQLKEKVCNYKGPNKKSIEEYLNTITFLFKSDDYKNEEEIRLVVQGIEFEKKYNKEVTPPKVYIELESIDKIVEQITLGPKVDKAIEWASAFHYCFDKEKEPVIILSHIAYK